MASVDKIAGVAETALQLLFNADNITVEKLQGIASNVETIFHNFRVESLRIRNFKVDIKWKTRVIAIPNAIKNLQTLWENARNIIDDKGKTLVAPFTEFVHTLKLLSLSESVPDPQGGPSKFAKAFDELSSFITQLNILIGAVDSATKEVANMGKLFDQILTDIETLDDVFLNNKTTRNKVTRTYFKRFGKRKV